MAFGGLRALRELGRGDVSVVGFDDVDAAALVRPALTTVRNPSYDTGRRAGELLLSRMLGRYKDKARTIMLPCPLVRRESA